MYKNIQKSLFVKSQTGDTKISVSRRLCINKFKNRL